MLTEQRHEIILNLLSEKGSITVTELKDILNTSESTIRRDLNTLDEQGRLTKVFGGKIDSGDIFHIRVAVKRKLFNTVYIYPFSVVYFIDITVV